LRRARWWYGREPEVYLALSRLSQLEGDGAKAAKHAERAANLLMERNQDSEVQRD